MELTISVLEAAVWVIVGVVSGVGVCWMLTGLQLGPLLREYHYGITGKDLLLNLLTVTCLIAFGILACWAIYGFRAMLMPLLFLFYSLGVSFVVSRIFFFASFERKQDMRIVQSWLEPELFLIPKPPNSFFISNADRQDAFPQNYPSCRYW